MSLSRPSPPLGGTPFDRRTALLAAGAGAAVGVTLPSGAAQAAGLQPTDLTFDIVRQRRRLNLVATGFVELHDRFEGDAERYAVLSPDGTAGEVRQRRGRLRLGGSPHFTLLRSRTGQVAPYAAVEVHVAELAGSDGVDRVYAGLVKDADNYVLAWYDGATGEAGVDACVDGAVQTLGSAAAGSYSEHFELVFALTSTTVVAFVDPGSGPVPVVQVRLDDVVDLRTPTALAAYRNAFGARSDTGTTSLASVRAGYFGQLGLRDPHLVTRADGRPYIRDGKAYFTFTQAGLAFFETAHWGVWTVDLRTYRLEQVGNLFFRREGLGAVLGDHAGHIVRDDANDRWIIANSTWGDFTFEGVEINYTTLPLSRDVLHGVHVLQTRRLRLPLDELPTAHVGQWDPHIVRIRGRWYVAFVNAREFFNFFPALARSRRGEDFTDLHLVGADPSKVETEGTVMQKFGDDWYLLASNGDNSPEAIRGEYPVYDLRMEQVGILDAPHPTNIPWPMVFPVRTPRGRARWVLVTFNGTQFNEPLLGYGTHGDVVVMEGHRTTAYPF